MGRKRKVSLSLPPIRDENTRRVSLQAEDERPADDEFAEPVIIEESAEYERDDRVEIMKKTLGMSVPNSEIEEIDVTARRLSVFDHDSNPVDNPKVLSLWDKLGQGSRRVSQGPSPGPSPIESATDSGHESIESVKFGYPTDDSQVSGLILYAKVCQMLPWCHLSWASGERVE